MFQLFYGLYEYFLQMFTSRRIFERNKSISEFDSSIESPSSPSNDQITSYFYTSTPQFNKSDSMRISKLQDEINELREMFMEHIKFCKEFHSSTSEMRRNNSNIASLALPPPPPPPPPPPLPNFFLTPNNNLIVQKKRSSESDKMKTPNKMQQNLPFCMKEILKDVGNVKLKPIKRSPGGHPIKPKPSETEEKENSFTEMLKKRFNAMNEIIIES